MEIVISVVKLPLQIRWKDLRVGKPLKIYLSSPLPRPDLLEDVSGLIQVTH
jgi:hypothetical protein